MQPAVKETLPIVLLPIALTAVLTALLALPALGVRTLPGGDRRLATLEAGFTVTVPGDPAQPPPVALLRRGPWLHEPALVERELLLRRRLRLASARGRRHGDSLKENGHPA